ncbi:DNA topoisomerase IV subunit A [Methanobrevibacter filiformis]|uniref:Type 2 DNA topoisomerase 6 subunit A n=1 Tax=Methanobrevibacter filiformis TaxID=55758 RepID=A0A166CCQ7_9EURY|nr:DNA topoisomerase IV subunit A [Methanobrevibacter filiformis]KZX14372.1 DNA topoisomerase 6 subunit A [Methanobrevibacter filiformis]
MADVKEVNRLDRKEITMNKLKGLGQTIIDDVNQSKIPSLKIPSRGTSNIVYDEDKRYYILGERAGKRSLGNVKQIKKLGQMIFVSNFCKDLVQREKTATLREMYYVSEGWGLGFDNQQESNIVGEDIEVTLGTSREDLGLMPEEDGASVYGDIVFQEGDVEINALKSGKSGYTISPTIDEVDFLDHNVERVIAVETMGMFHRMVQENAYKKFNTLIVGLKGQAARATRRFLKRVNQELNLPVYICNDGDPWGFHIAMVIISGSAKLAHVNHDLATPDAKFLGVSATDIVNYDLPTDPLKDIDVLRLKELSKDPRYRDEHWQNEIKKMLKIGRKAEQQSFSKYGLEYVVDTYFPEKLDAME